MVNDNYLLRGLTVTVNITHPNDPDLTAYLVAPDGVTRIKLFENVGAAGTHANFTNTVFDDNASTPVQFGGPPFFGSYNPQQPLSTLIGQNVNGTWTLEVQDSKAGSAGTISGWSLTFQKPLSNSGLGEPVADRQEANFRIFTMGLTNPLASSMWTAVGPGSINSGENSGRVGGLAIDPSDPSGNTVYAAGASGGVWKTTNFLTTDPNGPNWLPLTDFGPTFGINIGGIDVFGRNGDPNQSVVIVSTGEGDTGSRGAGFLISRDGGATWTLMDSRTNVDVSGNQLPFNSPLRDHVFVGSTSFKVLVDPKLTPTNEVIIYAALSGNNGGVWRSTDTGKHWQQMLSGDATDIALDYASDTGTTDGNIQNIYAAIKGQGVFFSTNRGQTWNTMPGGIGNPLLQHAEDPNKDEPLATTAAPSIPGSAGGRLLIAKPVPTTWTGPTQKVQYQGWLYAAEATTGGAFSGLYVTKDNGYNWTKVEIPTLPPVNGDIRAIPSNDTRLGDYSVNGSTMFPQGNYNFSLIVDPNDPAVVYIGGTRDGQPSGLIRVDTTAVADAHALVPYDNNGLNGSGGLETTTTGPLTLRDTTKSGPTPYYNLIRNPASPFLSNATLKIPNSATFNNQGSGATWIPLDFSGIIGGSTDQHRVVAMRDPLTGYTRIIFGDDQGIYSGLLRPTAPSSGTSARWSSRTTPATATSRSRSSTTGRRSPAAPRRRSPTLSSTARRRMTAPRSPRPA